MSKFKLKHPQLLLATSLLMLNPALAEEAASESLKDNKDIETITVSPKGLISYVAASASKSDTPIIETPISVSVLTERRIEDLGANTIQDAIGYVAGVYNGPYGVDTRGDWAQIRGVAPVTYLDGLQMLFGHYNNTRPNPYTLKQVEILKGPSSVLYGQGSTGGILNLVSKRPEAETKGELSAEAGNYNRKQLAGDITGAVNDDASLLYRLSGLYRDSETQTDHVDDNSLVIAPSLTWHISDETELTLLANVQKNESGSSTQFFPHEGTRLPAKYGQIPSNRFVSEPGYDKYDTEQRALTALFEHQLNDIFRLNISARYMDSEAEYRTMYAYPFKLQADKRTLIRSVSMSDATATALTSDIRLHGSFETGDIDHNLVFGLDYQNADTDTDRLFVFNGGGPLDVYNPTYGVNVDKLPTAADIPDTPKDNNTQHGFYIQDSMKLDNWIVNLGLRHDKAETDPGRGDKDEQSATTGRFGLMYAFDNGLSPYASYSESFLPIYGSNEQGKAFKPQRGEQLEVGIKYQPMGTEHLLTASVFDITDKNRKKQSVGSDGQLLTVQQGEVEIRGLELEAQLEWDEVDVYASYSYIDSEVISGDRGKEGASLSATPDHQLSAWVTYRPADFWQGFKMGAGFRYVGETSDGSIDVFLPNGVQAHRALTTESYHLYDLMVGYEFDNIDISLNIDNVADDTVITSCLARGDCFYGQRRTIVGSIKYKF